MVKIHSTKKIISASELKNGQLAQITHWGEHTEYIGRVVQRFGDRLITIGEDAGSSWTEISTLNPKNQVRILEDGEFIEVYNNQ